VAAAATYVNATMGYMVFMIGSAFDVNDYQSYHMTKEGSSFGVTYCDIVVVSIITYALVIALFAAFDILSIIILIVSRAIRKSELLAKAFHWVILLTCFGLGYLSIT
jgi:hypothetical protein